MQLKERPNNAKPDGKPRQMLSASSGVVRLGAVASGYRHIAPSEQTPSLANPDGNCGVSQQLWIYPACERLENGGLQIIER